MNFLPEEDPGKMKTFWNFYVTFCILLVIVL